jgi:hypothetical protein
MKSVFLLSLMSLSTFVWSAQDWKVVAVTTTACKEKFQVLAKEGEKFVYVTEGETKTKLYSEDGSAFSEQNSRSVVYTNRADKSLSATSKRYTFTQPSMVDPNPAKLELGTYQAQEKCKMTLK